MPFKRDAVHVIGEVEAFRERLQPEALGESETAAEPSVKIEKVEA